MPILSAADFEAVVDSGIDTATIEAAIAREEAVLARRLGGPLEGERTDTLYPAGHDGPLTLRRFVTAVTVTSDGTALDPSDIRLVADGRGRPGGAIERASGAWGEVVTITSTPDDAEAVKRYLIEAVRHRDIRPRWSRERFLVCWASGHERERAEATERREAIADGVREGYAEVHVDAGLWKGRPRRWWRDDPTTERKGLSGAALVDWAAAMAAKYPDNVQTS